MKLVQFGAGKIGRSFIGQLFHAAGYEVVFVDIDASLVGLLNQAGGYKVVIKSAEGDEVLQIDRIRALQLNAIEAVADEISSADIAAISVGVDGSQWLMPVLARGLQQRRESHPGWPLDVILAENMRDAATFYLTALAGYLPDDFDMETNVGLIETSIGKMVPIMTAADLREDPLQVFAEPYNTLIVDGKAFRNSVPEVPGLEAKENIKAWVDRKSFIHNLGHAAAAYYGHYLFPKAVYLWEVLQNEGVRAFCLDTMKEASEALLREYPGVFTETQLREHAGDLLRRFRNAALGDTLFRVGRDLRRKTGPNDRIAGALQLALRHGTSWAGILTALVHAMHFAALDQDSKPYIPDLEFQAEMGKDIAKVLESHVHLDRKRYSMVFDRAVQIEFRLYNKRTKSLQND